MREESFRKFFHLMITWGSCLSILLVNKSGKFLVLCKIYILKKRNSLIAKNKHIPSSCLKQIIDKLPHNFPDSFFSCRHASKYQACIENILESMVLMILLIYTMNQREMIIAYTSSVTNVPSFSHCSYTKCSQLFSLFFIIYFHCP